MTRIKRRGIVLLILPLAAVLAVTVVIPALDALRASFFRGVDFVGLKNYSVITGDRAFFYSLNVTAAWMGLTLSASTGISLLLAKLLHSWRGRKHSLLYGLLLIPLGIPIYIAVPLWRAFLHGDGGSSLFSALTGIEVNLLTDPFAAFFGAAAVSIWMSLPMTVFVFYAHLRQVGKDLVDAAKLETSRTATVLKCVELPVISSSVMIMLALNGIKAMKEFTLIHLMTDGGVPLVSGITEKYIIGSTTTVSVFLYDLFTGLNSYGITAAFAVLMSLLVAVCMVFWFGTRFSGRERKSLFLRGYLTALFFLYGLLNRSDPSGLITAVLLLLCMRKERFFCYVLMLSLAVTAVRVLAVGFLEGFSPLVPFVLFVLAVTGRGEQKEAAGIEEAGLTAGSRLAAGLFAVSCIIILYYLIWLSFSGVRACYVDSFLPPYATFSAYRQLFFEEKFLRYIGNTVILAAGTALLVPFVVIPASWAAAHMKKRASDTLVSAVQVLNVSSGMHSLIPLFALLASLSLTNTRSALVLIYCAHALPFSLILMRNHMENRSLELQEAAMLDGAGTAAYLRYIFIPISFPVVKTMMLFAWLGAWNGFVAPLILLSDEAKYPISLKLYSYVGSIGSGAPQWHLFAAASVVNLLIIRVIGGKRLGSFRLK